ncbi:MAG: transposase [Thiomicrorhabdus sp.]|nr:transposase [Thiomicrorhabdus sp.]
MARPLRMNPVGVPQHVVQRGNNRQDCFVDEEDYGRYVHWLKQYSAKYHVAVHAWVLMSNHVHLLCTPLAENAVSSMMQALGRQYVRYFNFKYKRTGTLWEGRFRSCLIDSEQHLLEVYRYIELNPVRAGMVNTPDEYKWSSFQVNGLGVESELCTPHELYQALGWRGLERRAAYLSLFEAELDAEWLKALRKATMGGKIFGGDAFQTEITALEAKKQVDKQKNTTNERNLGGRGRFLL